MWMEDPRLRAHPDREARIDAAIRVDSSSAVTTYANTCHVSSTQEELVLNFGLNQNWDRSAEAELLVRVTHRLILNPYAAKRLAILLGATMQQYESRFGPLPLAGGPVLGTPAANGAGTEATSRDAIR
jgi:hypothetical protein